MNAWPVVPWSSADQVIIAINGGQSFAGSDFTPADYFRELVAQNRPAEAVQFIAHALPRYECIAWATHALLDSGTCNRGSALIGAILRWIDDPDDTARRSVRGLADAMRDSQPEHFLGMAVFFSGGSISEPNLPPVLPRNDLTAKFASGAVLRAAILGNTSAIFQRAIEIGDTIAQTQRTR